MNEDAIKTEMRLWALEVLVCNLIAIVCLSDPAPAELLSRTREKIVAGARTRTFSGVDAAISDLYVEAAVARFDGHGSCANEPASNRDRQTRLKSLPCEFHHLRPLLSLLGDVSAEVVRRAGEHRGAEVG
jgi:hypothetical protein